MRRRGQNRRKRIPKLAFMEAQDVGWHVSFRDPATGAPCRHRFGIRERKHEERARALYHAWVAKHLGVDTSLAIKHERPRLPGSSGPKQLSGSLLEIGSALIETERTRVRKEGDARRRGSIDPRVFSDRRKQIHDFLEFLNARHGAFAVAKLRLADLSMEDVEAYNRHITGQDYSASQVAKRMWIVKAIIDRAGRPEHGKQSLAWNWDSRDVTHGAPTQERVLPTVKQLRRLLLAADLRGRVMIWLGMGLGLGARDLAAVRVGQIVEDAYDLRRGKTGVERYGATPRLVWLYVCRYQAAAKRRAGDLLFATRNGLPLVHGSSNAVTQWWDRLRGDVAKENESLCGFYTLRHLGATEFGSRPGSSIGEVKRWLGHSASSHMADLYMRPVKPEYREVVTWVRRKLTAPPHNRD